MRCGIFCILMLQTNDLHGIIQMFARCDQHRANITGNLKLAGCGKDIVTCLIPPASKSWRFLCLSPKKRNNTWLFTAMCNSCVSFALIVMIGVLLSKEKQHVASRLLNQRALFDLNVCQNRKIGEEVHRPKNKLTFLRHKTIVASIAIFVLAVLFGVMGVQLSYASNGIICFHMP